MIEWEWAEDLSSGPTHGVGCIRATLDGRWVAQMIPAPVVVEMKVSPGHAATVIRAICMGIEGAFNRPENWQGVTPAPAKRRILRLGE